MGKHIIFSVYRYQLLPLSINFQQRIGSEYGSTEELIKNKNHIFHKIISDPNVKYRGKGYNVISKLESANEDVYFFRLGVQKILNLHDKNFNLKTDYDYPNSLVYINNDPEEQFLLIEQEAAAFYDTMALKNILEKSWNIHLNELGLSIYINKITEVSSFWATMLEFKGRITSLRFDFIRPNMSNISAKAVEAIKILKNQANSHKTVLELNAPKNGVLENLDPENTEIAGLAEYQSNGGGTSTIRIRGHRKRIITSRKQIEIEIDETLIEEVPYNKISEVLEAYLKNINE